MALMAGCAPAEDISATIKANLEGNERYAFFNQTYLDKKLLAALEGDFDVDGTEDLIIVFNEDKNASFLVTIYVQGGAFFLTEPISAPVDSCRLEWRDINEEPPGELIVSGQKGINYGYGIYHFIDFHWHSLYGDMQDCC